MKAALSRTLGNGQWDEEEHPRDSGGKFTHSGGGSNAGDATIAGGTAAHTHMVLTTSRKLAEEMGFDPSKISLGAQEGPERKFTLNGVEYRAAGLAYIHHGPMEGKIKLYADALPTPEVVKAVTAHEVMHHKVQNALDRYKVEYDMIMKLDAKTIDIMRADGSLKPPYDTKYPGYTAMHAALYNTGMREFADSDGVSEYSYEYWKGWKAGTVNTDIALHETLAEMARFKQMTGEFPDHMGERIISYRGEDVPKPSQEQMNKNAERWRNLYRVIEKLY